MEELTTVFRQMNYRICPKVTASTAFVVSNLSDRSDPSLAEAISLNIPILYESEMFEPEEDVTDDSTESEDELVIDDSLLGDDSEEEKPDSGVVLRIDTADDDEILSCDNETNVDGIPPSGSRLLRTRIAFIGRFLTPFVQLRQRVLEEGGVITPVQDLARPATHVVLSKDLGTREEFLKKYSNFWWIRSAVFISEENLLSVCDGFEKIKTPKIRERKLPEQAPSTIQSSMQLLSLSTSGPSQQAGVGNLHYPLWNTLIPSSGVYQTERVGSDHP